MIYLVLGDAKKSREKMQTLVAAFVKANQNTTVFESDENNFSEEWWNEHYKNSGLFSAKNLIIAKKHFTSPVLAKFHLNNLEKYNRTEHVIFFWEDAAEEKYIKAIQKHTTHIYAMEPQEKKEKSLRPKALEDKKLFDMCDALAKRNRHNSWVIYRENINNGTPAEIIFWKIFWQIKTLLQIKETGGEGLHPFVYQKNKKNADLFGKEELKKFSSELTDMYHHCRFGKSELGLVLEKFIIKI